MNDTDAKKLLRQLQYQEHMRNGTLTAQMTQAPDPKGGFVDQMMTKLQNVYGKEGFQEVQEYRKSKEDQLQLPTDLQEKNPFLILSEVIKHIEEAVTDMKYELPRRPVIGTLHTGHVNGLSIHVTSSGEYLYLVDHDLFTFVLLLSKFVARCMPVLPSGGFGTDPEQTLKTMQSSKALDSFYDLLMAYLIAGAPGAARPYVVENPKTQALFQIFLDSMEHFVIGHEYGHVISKHDDKTQITDVYGEKVETLHRTWKEEIRADSIGLSLTLHAMRRTRQIDATLTFLSVDLFLHMLEIVEKSAWLMMQGTEEVPYKDGVTVLPPALRRYALMKGMEPVLPKELYENVLKLANDGHAILDFAYQAVKPQLLKMHEEKKKPAAIWQAFVQRLLASS